jgi:Family of unknown function (DUF6600)
MDLNGVNRRSAMKIPSRLFLGLLVCAALVAGSQLWAQAVSYARIVRLSFAEGNVSIERPDSPGFATAPVNTPIQQGFKLATSEDSFAEVEFENSSTARIGQGSLLAFEQLALESSGGKLNRLVLRQGYGTFNFIPEDGDVYQLQAGDATVTLATNKETQFRADLEGSNVRVEVFKGAIDVASPFGSERLTKNAVYEMRPGTDNPVNLAHGITKDAWDEWVKDRDDQAQTAHRNSPPGLYSNNVTDLLYGWNDLYYYGGWTSINGYGNCWIPRVTYGWSPYSNGQWTFLPGVGPTWISFEPWGWMPFHYGGWQFQPGYGWFWVPGGFGSWSPALVSWYQGPGWVGWQPLPPNHRGGGNHSNRSAADCPAGRSCTTVVSTDAFREGRPVHGHRIDTVRVTQAFAVERPDLTSADLARPGSGPRMDLGTAGVAPVRSRLANEGSGSGPEPAARVQEAATSAGGVHAGPQTAFRTAPKSTTGAGPHGASADGPVVFDPVEGRFVNGHGSDAAALPKVPTQPGQVVSAAEIIPDASVASSPQIAPAGGGAVKAPMAVHPVGQAGNLSGLNHHASPQSGIEPKPSTGFTQRVFRSFGFGQQEKQSGGSGSSQQSSSTWSTGNSGNSSSQVSTGGSHSSSAPSGSYHTSSPSSGGGSSAGAAHSAPTHSTGRPH